MRVVTWQALVVVLLVNSGRGEHDDTSYQQRRARMQTSAAGRGHVVRVLALRGGAGGEGHGGNAAMATGSPASLAQPRNVNSCALVGGGIWGEELEELEWEHEATSTDDWRYSYAFAIGYMPVCMHMNEHMHIYEYIHTRMSCTQWQ